MRATVFWVEWWWMGFCGVWALWRGGMWNLRLWWGWWSRGRVERSRLRSVRVSGSIWGSWSLWNGWNLQCAACRWSLGRVQIAFAGFARSCSRILRRLRFWSRFLIGFALCACRRLWICCAQMLERIFPPRKAPNSQNRIGLCWKPHKALIGKVSNLSARQTQRGQSSISFQFWHQPCSIDSLYCYRIAQSIGSLINF